MTKPGREHPIALEAAQRRWRAYFNHHVIADTDDALILREAHLAPVVYFPRDDVAMEYMGRTERRTHCPFKGDAAYYTLTMGGQIRENVAWSYETPLEGMDPIAGRIAFYADQIEIYSVDDAAVNPHHHERERERLEPEPRAIAEPERERPLSERAEIDEVILHTDAGNGASQREHWPPNVETPGSEEGGVR